MKTACLLLLTPLVLPPVSSSAIGAQQSPPTQQWRQSQETDARRGTTYTQFTLAGKFLKPPRNGGSDRPTLVVKCTPAKHSRGPNGRFSAGSLRVGTLLKIDWVEPEVIHGIGYYPKVSVRYRLDEGKTRQDQWSPDEDKTSTSFPKNALKEMLRAHSVLITVNEGLGAEVAMQFDIPDPTQVAEACGMVAHKK